MSGGRGARKCNFYGNNHNHQKNTSNFKGGKKQTGSNKGYSANTSYYDNSNKALWLPWPPVLPVSKPLQIIWMVHVPGSPLGPDSSPPEGASTTSIPQGPGVGPAAAACPASQPPLIANPPSQPLIIPSHVANALLLTR